MSSQLPLQLHSVPQQMSQPHQANPQGTEHRYDLIERVRKLIWNLKESLANLMKIAAKNLQQNSLIDTGQKTNEEQVPRFDKALEEFFSICNQIELHLKTIQECAIQAKDSQQYLPFTVMPAQKERENEPTGESVVTYNQYLTTIKTQINFAKQVQDMLIDGARRITEPSMPGMPLGPPNVMPVVPNSGV